MATVASGEEESLPTIHKFQHGPFLDVRFTLQVRRPQSSSLDQFHTKPRTYSKYHRPCTGKRHGSIIYKTCRHVRDLRLQLQRQGSFFKNRGENARARATCRMHRYLLDFLSSVGGQSWFCFQPSNYFIVGVLFGFLLWLQDVSSALSKIFCTLLTLAETKPSG